MTTPYLAVLIPIVAAPVAPILFNKKGSNEFTAIINVLVWLIVMSMYPAVSNGEILEVSFSTGLVLDLSFMVDSLSLLVGGISATVWMIASIYSIGYMGHEENLGRYNMFSLLSLAGMLGVVFTKNLFTLYIFFEMLSVCSYIMVIHKQDKEAMDAGLKYLFMGVGGGLILLMSMVATYSITGTCDLNTIANTGLGLSGHLWAPWIFAGFVIGFGVKAGIFPVYGWLPDAHPVAPAPASALLSGIMIKAGGYGILRTVYTIFGIEVISHTSMIHVLLLIGFINIVLGSAMALRQTEIKRMMAYSSIAQIGYVIMGIALLTPRGLTGGAVHIFNHAIIKGTLFLCAGAFIHQTGLRKIEDLKGIGRAMPLTTICFTLGGLSMIGFPPFNGFISKWFLALGAIDVARMGVYPSSVGVVALSVLLLSSFLNLTYYCPIIYRAWFPDRSEKLAVDALSGGSHDPEGYMMIPLMVLASFTLIFGIFPSWPLALAMKVSHMIL